MLSNSAPNNKKPGRLSYAPLDVSAPEDRDQEAGTWTFEPTLSNAGTHRESSACARNKTTVCWSIVGVGFLVLTILAFAGVSHKKSLESTWVPRDMLWGMVHPVPVLEEDFRGKPRQLASEHGMVSSDNGRCSQIGADVLGDGGNAVDAAVAAAFCIGVVNSVSSGIGGGAFITIYLPNGTAEVVNAREPAPAAANSTMYSGKGRYASLDGGLAIAVPLETKGLYLAWQRYGVLPWQRLVLPAAVLAQKGFAMHPYLRWVSSGPFTIKRINDSVLLREAFMIRDKKVPGGWRLPEVGEHCCRRPRLGATLRRVAKEGPGWLYASPVAEHLATEVQAAGGIITADDIKAAEVLVEAAQRYPIGDGYELLVPPPPSSALAMGGALRIMSGFDALADRLSPHLTVEAMKHAFAVRLSLGDPGTKENPQWDVAPVVADLLNDTFINSLRDVLDRNRTLAPEQYGGRWNPGAGAAVDDHGTSHLCVVDARGAAVAITSSVNTAFGSAVVSASTGMLFNNQMDDFSKPDMANTYHLPPSRANFIQPGKRPLSSMSPSIVIKAGRVRMVAGASGGPLIISATYQSLLRVLLQNKTAWEAVTEPRMHDQVYPNRLLVEDYTFGNITVRMPDATRQLLKSQGHNVSSLPYPLGFNNIITVDTRGVAVGVGDPRKDAAPAAFAP